jgi:hypothetical protein
MHMTNEDRRYLAELGREQDRLLAEHAEWTAKREAAGEAPVRKSDDDLGLVYRTQEDGLHDAPQPEPQPSDDEPSLGYAVREFAAATSRRFDRLEHAHAELRGQVSALLTLLGQKSGGLQRSGKPESEVIDLPDWRSRRDVA